MTHHARLNCPARAVVLAGLIFFLSAFSFPRRKGAVPASPETPSTSTQFPTQTLTYTPGETVTVELTPSSVASETPPPSSTPYPLHTPTLSETASSSPTPTATLPPMPPSTNTEVPRTYSPLSVLINEVAWAGTFASSSDEWIELNNPGTTPIDLTGWVLSDGSDLRINLAGTITARGYYLLERTDDDTVFDIHADQIYSGCLRNDGESLRLQSPSGKVIDSANLGGGS